MSSNGILNVKEIVVNTSWIDYHLIRDYSTQSTFYNNTQLIEDLGEDVRTYKKTYRIFENSHGMLMSNGIYYDKDNDMLHTPSTCYTNWYSKLLLDYYISRWFMYDFYNDKLQWFTIVPTDDESFAVVKNKCIGMRGFLNAGDLTMFNSLEMLEATKNVVVWKNADTYVTQKTEYLWPHEIQYSVHNMNRFTSFDRTTYWGDLSSKLDEVSSRLGFDITAIANLAAGVLFSAYGADKDDVIPIFLNMNKNISYTGQRLNSFTTITDNTDDILYHGYLGQEYALNFNWDDYSTSIDVLNQYIEEIHDATTDMIKNIIPQINFLNGVKLSPYDRYISISRRDSILTDRTAWPVKSIVSIRLNDTSDVMNIAHINAGTVYTTDFTIDDVKSDFFSIYPDLSTESISTIIDSISDQDELHTSNLIWLPVLLFDSTVYTSLNAVANISRVYLYSVIMWNIIKNLAFIDSWTDSSSQVHEFVGLSGFESNILALDIASYDSLAASTKYAVYVDKILALNLKFRLAPLLSNVFNPSIYDDIRSMSQSVAAYSTSSKFRESYDQSIFDLAEADCKIEFDETAADSTLLFFLAQAVSDIDYAVFTGADITGIQYQQTGPSYVFMAELDTTGWQEPVSNIRLVFDNDNTKLQYVPVDLENSNIVKIPYKGLLLIDNIVDGENLELENFYLHRDLTSNNWTCKLKLLKYDQLDLNRILKFNMYGNTELSVTQRLMYEFGLGFELVSSENIDNMEILRMLYVLISQTQSSSNIFIERILQDASKLKLIFKKLTSDPITLRTIVGYKNDQSIINQVDTII